VNIFEKTGSAFFAFLRYIFVLFALLYLSLKVLWTNRDLGHRDFIRQVFLQIYFTGVQAVLPVTIIALGVGSFAIISGVGGLGATFSGAEQIGRMVTVVVIREIAPLLTGGIVIVRSITAITTEIGGMRVQREIEALEAMGISPVRQLITPRIFGGLLSFAGLNVLFSAVALFCGFIIAQTVVTIPAELFFQSVFSAVKPADILGLTIKVLLGGTGIFVIACYHGMSVTRSSTEVPIAVSKASLNSLVFLLIVDVAVSSMMLLQGDSAQMLGGIL
jgi:phospholipid/cholesterol/gamma-HCH transport system permease protein